MSDADAFDRQWQARPRRGPWLAIGGAMLAAAAASVLGLALVAWTFGWIGAPGALLGGGLGGFAAQPGCWVTPDECVTYGDETPDLGPEQTRCAEGWRDAGCPLDASLVGVCEISGAPSRSFYLRGFQFSSPGHARAACASVWHGQWRRVWTEVTLREWAEAEAAKCDAPGVDSALVKFDEAICRTDLAWGLAAEPDAAALRRELDEAASSAAAAARAALPDAPSAALCERAGEVADGQGSPDGTALAVAVTSRCEPSP
ncbi:MAG: hypothetical protein R3F59_31405 [Myxococcota bacterium]